MASEERFKAKGVAPSIVIGLVALSLFIGFSGARWTTDGSDPNSISMKAPIESSAAAGLRKLQDLTERDLAEYYRLQTLEEKYLKADELLGKMVTIFLADLGLHLSPALKKTLTEHAGASPPPIHTSDATPPSSVSKPLKNVAQTAIAGVDRPIQPTTISAMPFEEIRSPHDVEDFLKASRISDFDSALQASKGFANKSGVLDEINGRFTGVANVVSNGKPEKWDIRFGLNGKFDEKNGKKKFTGAVNVAMAKGGKVFSNKRGNGSLDRDVRELPSDPRAVLFEASPDTYLQIYYVKRLDSIIANILVKDGDAPYATIGSMQLVRD